MKNFLLLILMLAISSCSDDFKYDELDYNLYGGSGRTNSYEHFGDFPLQLVTDDKIVSDDSSGVIQSALRLKSPYTILANVNGKILRVNNLTVDKQFEIDSNFVPASGMAADRNSNIYFISSNDMLYCLDFNLKLKWKIKIPIPSSRILSYSDLLVTKEGIVLGANTGDIFKYDFGGKVVWQYKSSLAIGKTFSADSTGNIYLPLTNNEFGITDSITSIDKNGKLNWQTALPRTRILSSTVCRNDMIYVTGAKEIDSKRNGATYCITQSGKIIWAAETTLSGRNVSVDYDDNCYIAGMSSGVGEISTGIYCFDKKGKEIWNIYIGAAAVSPLIISEKYLGFTAFTGEGAAMLFLRKSDGMLVRNHSLSNLPPLYLQPLVSDDATVRLFGSNKLRQIKFTETSLNKFLP